MRNIWLFLAALILSAPILGGAPPALAQEQTPQQTPEDRVLGKADAPITIFEYASLTCPHCAAFDRETLPKVKENWIDTGKAKLIFRDFPLDGLALRAAMLARCAPPDRFYGFIDTLFQSQQTWEHAKDPMEALEHIARLGGMTEDQFKSCMKNEQVSNAVVGSETLAQKEYGVNSTPTFFINGTKIEGAQPYDAFDKALTAALPKS
jgi:protein-disulfide isomerase